MVFPVTCSRCIFRFVRLSFLLLVAVYALNRRFRMVQP